MAEQQTPYVVMQANAPQVAQWLATRGGTCVWNCVDPSEPTKRWLAPRLGEDGQPKGKPHRDAGTVIRTMTRPEEFVVVEAKEYRRFHVDLRPAAQDGKIKLTDTSGAHLLEEMEAATELDDRAYYDFDHETQEAVIYVPATSVPMADWLNGRDENPERF